MIFIEFSITYMSIEHVNKLISSEISKTNKKTALTSGKDSQSINSGDLHFINGSC